MDEKKSVKGSRDPEGRMIFLVEFTGGGGKTKKISVKDFVTREGLLDG